MHCQGCGLSFGSFQAYRIHVQHCAGSGLSKKRKKNVMLQWINKILKRLSLS